MRWMETSNGRQQEELTWDLYSGIFGYINYLVEKDRKFILDTLINGEQRPPPNQISQCFPIPSRCLLSLQIGYMTPRPPPPSAKWRDTRSFADTYPRTRPVPS